jgi:hypothetical protein
MSAWTVVEKEFAADVKFMSALFPVGDKMALHGRDKGMITACKGVPRASILNESNDLICDKNTPDKVKLVSDLFLPSFLQEMFTWCSYFCGFERQVG